MSQPAHEPDGPENRGPLVMGAVRAIKNMRLYHFLSAENALDDLKNKRVKISIIEKLNDPFEFQAGFVKPNRTLRAQFSQFRTNISKEFGIFCCSKNWHNPLLWSHYASKHTGIALGFNMPNSKAIKVTYSKDRPLFASDSLSKKSGNTEYLEKLVKQNCHHGRTKKRSDSFTS